MEQELVVRRLLEKKVCQNVLEIIIDYMSPMVEIYDYDEMLGERNSEEEENDGKDYNYFENDDFGDDDEENDSNFFDFVD